MGIAASALLALKLLALVLGPESDHLPINGAIAQENSQETSAEGGADATPAASGEEGDVAGPQPPGDGSSDVPALPQSLEIGGSAAERAVLESLGKRRETLNEQAGELDMREKLLQATEERIQKQLQELKKLEESIGSVVEEKKQQEKDDIASLVTMYESMKPKDAARIFDRLSLPILLKVVRKMKPRKMADVLARMSPDAAEKLTVAIASDTDGTMTEDTGDQAQVPTQSVLPKIQSN
ncbi:hypothetical protein FMN50_26425 [Rhodobacterales bacterium]|nr:hypothetical protein FMN50_26425 [Rhodobacterales bacterium]